MRSIFVVVLLLGCGGSGAATVDGGGGGGGGGSGDAASAADAAAAFCDGSAHPIGNGLVRAAAVDAQGRLVVLGTQVMPRQTWYLRRFEPDGTLDTSFGDAGVVTTPEITDGEAFAFLPDGGILVGGGLVTGSDIDAVQAPLLVGYDGDGQPTGFRVTEPPTDSSRYVQAIMLQGSSYVVEIDYLLRRLDQTGTFDATFGGGGSASVGLSEVAQTDDGFVIADSRLQKLSIYRLTADGQQVAGSAAMLDTDAYRVNAVLPRGNDVTLVGDTNAGQPNDMVVGRILANGQPDTASYGPQGFVVLDAGNVDDMRAAYALPDGSLLLGGIEPPAAAVRVTPDGTLAHVYAFYSGTVAAVTLWNGMVTIAGNTDTSGAIACRPL